MVQEMLLITTLSTRLWSKVCLQPGKNQGLYIAVYLFSICIKLSMGKIKYFSSGIISGISFYLYQLTINSKREIISDELRG